jgi:WD40 repeat protein
MFLRAWNHSRMSAPAFAASRQKVRQRLAWASASVASVLLCPALAIGLDGEVRLLGHEHNVNTVMFSPDGKRVLTKSFSGAIVYDAATGEQILNRKDPSSNQDHAATYSPDGKHIAAVLGGRFMACDSETGDDIFKITEHDPRVFRHGVVAYSPDGKLLLVSQGVVDPTTLAPAFVFKDHNGETVWFQRRALFLAKGRRLAGIVRHDGKNQCVLLDLPPQAGAATVEVVVQPSNILGPANAITVSADGRFVATAHEEQFQLWNAADGTPSGSPVAISRTFLPPSIGFSPDGKYIALGEKKTVTVFDVDSRALVGAFEISDTDDSVTSLAFSPDGSRMVVGLQKKPIALIWNVRVELSRKLEAVQKEAAAIAARREAREKLEAAIRMKQKEEAARAEVERERQAKEMEARRAKEAEEKRLADIEREKRLKEIAASERERLAKQAAMLAEAEAKAQSDLIAARERQQQLAETAEAEVVKALAAETAEERDQRKAQATAAVGVLIGKTSTHYDEYGFKGVRLGQTFSDVKKQHTLVNNGEYTGLTSTYEDEETGESFVFSDKEQLVSYGRHYQGGASEYAPQLIELFGKVADTRMQTRDQTPANSSMRVTYTTVDYTFPKVLVRVVHEDRTEGGVGAGKLTHVFVADREWVEAILFRTAVDKLRALQWLQSAAGLAQQGVFDSAKIPAIPGTRVEVVPGQGHCLQFIDTRREAGLKPKWGEDATRLATCAAVEQALPGLQPVVYFDCVRYSGTRIGAKVKVSAQEGRVIPELAEPIQNTPILNAWLWKLNQLLLEKAFPPSDGKVLLVRKPDVVGVQEWLEWTSNREDHDSWKILCGKNLLMRVEYLGRKKL